MLEIVPPLRIGVKVQIGPVRQAVQMSRSLHGGARGIAYPEANFALGSLRAQRGNGAKQQQAFGRRPHDLQLLYRG